MPGKTVIPPNSAIRVNGKLTQPIEGSYIIKPQEDIPVMMPRCVYSEQTSPRLCLVNASDWYFTIRKGTVVGEALSAHPVTIVSEPKSQTNGPLKELPEHLNSLFQKSVTDLDQSQRTLLMDLLEEYQDGCFCSE